jgi:hypothetical protein
MEHCEIPYNFRSIMTPEEKIFEEFEIPQEFQADMSYHAYERGHSAGYDEVLIHLRELASVMSKPIKAFEKRITKS